MDVIAIVVILGCFVLIYCNKDGFMSATLTMIVGYYFGKTTSTNTREVKNTKENEKPTTPNN